MDRNEDFGVKPVSLLFASPQSLSLPFANLKPVRSRHCVRTPCFVAHGQSANHAMTSLEGPMADALTLSLTRLDSPMAHASTLLLTCLDSPTGKASTLLLTSLDSTMTLSLTCLDSSTTAPQACHGPCHDMHRTTPLVCHGPCHGTPKTCPQACDGSLTFTHVFVACWVIEPRITSKQHKNPNGLVGEN